MPSPVTSPAPPVGKRERAKTEKRARILGVALRLFRERGYEETTTLLISREAGIATGTLFLYFATKEDLLIALFSDRIREHIARFERDFLPQGDPARHLGGFFTEMIALHGEDPELTRHFIRAIAIIRDRHLAHDVSNLARRSNLAIARVILALQRAGAISRLHSPRTAAQILFGTYFTTLIEWANGGISQDQLHTRIQAAVGLMLRAMAG